MNPRILTLWLLALATTATLVSAAAAAAAAAADNTEPRSPSLQGTWTLNEDLTGRLRQSEPQSGLREGGGGGLGGFGGGFPGDGLPGGAGGDGLPGGTGVPGGSGYPVDPPPGGKMREPAEGPRPNFAALDTLTITQTASEVTVTDRDGHAHVYRTDGSKARDEKAFGGPAEVQARWDKDGSLIVKVRSNKGARRTESYIVSNDGKHLYLVLTLEGNFREPQTIRRAYDPAPAGKPAETGKNSSSPPPAGRVDPHYHGRTMFP